MKNLNLLSFLIFLGAFPLKSQVLNNNNIIADTTWSSDTIRIYNDVTVQYPATLTINPGVYVEFQGNYSINVQGSIKAIGTMNDTIVFTIFDTTSYADTATLAGGWGSIKLLDNPTDTSEFRYCTFSYGKAIDPGHTIWDHLNEENWGGALFVKNYGNVFCSNSYFYNNRANFAGGAIWVKYCSSLQLINNSFIMNQTFQQGGGASIGNCSSAIISNNLFKLNKAFVTFETSVGTAVRGTGGGLRVNINCNALVVNNKFFNNHSVNGSGLYETTSNCMIYNNVIANNMGNGIMNGHGFSTSTYANNTIVNNLAYSHTGCGIVYSSIFLKMRNNIIWGNDVIPAWNIDPIQLYCPDGTIADFTYMCNPDGYPGEGNITANPLFVNPTAGAGPDYDGLSADWSLLDSSPCVNTGTPDTTGLHLPAFDLAGNPRVFGGRVDIGAYENQHVYVKINDSPVFNTIKLYPNPGNERMVIEILPGMEGAVIEIVDGQGKVCMHEQIRHSPMVLFPDKLVAGIYFYRVYNQTGILQSGKWVKR